MGLRLTLVAILSATLLMPALEAHAQSPDAYGWWTSENPGVGSPAVPPELPTSGGPYPFLPSDIPQGGFEVANIGPTQSYVALSVLLYGDVRATRMSLTVVPDAANLPTSDVQLCPLSPSATFASTYGGALASGPGYDCAHPVPGIGSTDGKTFTFDVKSIAQPGRFAVAVVGMGLTRMVFAKPDRQTITLQATTSVTDGQSGSGGFATEPPAVVSAPDDTQPSQAIAASEPEPSTFGPDASSTSPPESPPQVNPQVALVTLHAPREGTHGAAVGALLLTLLAALAWVRNRQRDQDPRVGTG